MIRSIKELIKCLISDLPYYVRNKFQCGFPDDWNEVKCKWVEYISQGEFTTYNIIDRNIYVVL
jgi:hypothetical protein